MAVPSAAVLVGRETMVVETQHPFDPNEARSTLSRGAAVLSGEAFLGQAGRGGPTRAGETVTLLPAALSQQDRMRRIYGRVDGGVRANVSGHVPPERDPRAMQLDRHATCDAQGDFEFGGVSAGDYHVHARAVWPVGSATQGGFLAKRLPLSFGQRVKVLLG